MSGNAWKFSDLIDDADLVFLQREFITYFEGADYYGLGLKKFTRLAHEAGAVYKIGKAVRIRRDIFDAYLRKLQKKENKFICPFLAEQYMNNEKEDSDYGEQY